MNSYTSLKIGSLLLAVPSHEVAQISLTKDMHYESGFACIPYHTDLIRVISIDERFSSVRQGFCDIKSPYIITLACPDDDFRYSARIALQIEATAKIAIINSGQIPQTMKQIKSPINGWYVDQAKNRGFLTDTAALELFINHATQVFSDDGHSTMAG